MDRKGGFRRGLQRGGLMFRRVKSAYNRGKDPTLSSLSVLRELNP